MLDFTPLAFLCYGLAGVVILGALGAVCLLIVIAWLWITAPPRNR